MGTEYAKGGRRVFGWMMLSDLGNADGVGMGTALTAADPERHCRTNLRCDASRRIIQRCPGPWRPKLRAERG
jgi:hypothetical protein